MDDSETPDKEELGDAVAAMAHAEIRAVFEKDETLLGDVWRRTEAGESPEQISAARGTERPNFVWNYRRTARAILDGDLPTAPTVALGAARALRRLLRETEFSSPTRSLLEKRLETLERNAADPTARAVEEKQALDVSVVVEEHADPGVYVYALPHYLRHPYDEESGHTLLKVGMANRSVIRRFREQIRTTALPEDPVLLRVYVSPEDDASAVEKQFHRLLEAADHDRSTARTGGTEWFLTSVRFLDEIATTLNLEIRDVVDLADFA